MVRALTRQHRADLKELTGFAANDLALIWAALNAAAGFDGLMDELPTLVGMYGAAAATLGADWYDELRDAEDIAGRFTAITAGPPPKSRVYALAGWGSAEAAKNPDTALTLVSGGLQRIISDSDRESVTVSAVADPKSTGWKRVSGSDAPCDWCLTVIGYDRVYSEASAEFLSHDNCFCTAEPEFG